MQNRRDWRLTSRQFFSIGFQKQFKMKIYRSMFVLPTIVLVILKSSGAPLPESNWPQFRGLGARGVSTNPNLPDRWSSTENVSWKTEIPGRGWSSPIVWGDQVFLTTAISSGQVEPPKKGLYFGGERKDAPRPEHEWK